MELKAEKKALLVGETLTVNCIARGSDLLEQQWKYPGKVIRDNTVSIFCICAVSNIAVKHIFFSEFTIVVSFCLSLSGGRC